MGILKKLQLKPSEQLQAFFLAEMYGELRWYREKEYNTFLFAFAVIGVGFQTSFRSVYFCTILLVFGVTSIFYLWKNHARMMRIKAVMVKTQEHLGINKLPSVQETLNPQSWSKKPWYKHLGTMTYSGLIIFEMILLVLATSSDVIPQIVR